MPLVPRRAAAMMTRGYFLHLQLRQSLPASGPMCRRWSSIAFERPESRRLRISNYRVLSGQAPRLERHLNPFAVPITERDRARSHKT